MNLIGDIWNFIYYLFTNVGSWIDTQVLPLVPDWLGYIVYALVRIGAILGFVIVTVLLFIYMERRIVARFQSRLGPNRVGPFGLLQGFADVIKLLTKEVITPARADPLLHMLAPIIAIIPSFLALAVIPFAPGAVLADLNVAVLYILAVGTAGTLSVLMAGWSSNNKYSLMGAMRLVAMTISYELPLVLALLGAAMVTQTLSLGGIIAWQTAHGWLVLYQPIGLVLFFIAAMAELGRSPFDLIEGESEITGGYHTEYGGIEFAMLFLREYTDAIVVSFLVAVIYLGGWDTSFFGILKGQVPDILGWVPPYVLLFVKTCFVFFFMLWSRSTFPRLRIDHVLDFCWKFLLPVALVNIFISAVGIIVSFAAGDSPIVLFVFSLLNVGAALAVLVGWQNRFIGRKWALQPMV